MTDYRCGRCGGEMEHRGNKGLVCKGCGATLEMSDSDAQAYRAARRARLDPRKVSYYDLDDTTENPAPPFPQPDRGKGVCRWCWQPAYSKLATWCGTWVDFHTGSGKRRDGKDGYWRSECKTAVWEWWYRTTALRRAVFKRDGYKCRTCGKMPLTAVAGRLVPDLKQLHADHIVPIDAGGQTVWQNLQTLCDRCNLQKGARTDAPATV